MELTIETITAARQRLDAQIAGACIRAAQPFRIEEMISSVLTLEQVESALRQPAAQPPHGGHRAPASVGEFESIARTAFARMVTAAPAPAPSSSRVPAPANDRAAFSSAAWPAGRPA